jgi:cyclopropane fatty-acyl-phospholipid synthase-like methyltransferase
VEAHPDIDEEWDAFAERDVRLVKYLVRNGVIDPGSRVLDFGAGSGHVAAAAQRQVVEGEVVCVEADADTASQLRARGLKAVQALEEARGPFDAILAIEVIEHVVDAKGTLSTLAGLLRPGGVLFITTPCGETRRGKRSGTVAYDVPAHVHFFTEPSLELALRLAGFERTGLRVINAMYPRDSGLRAVSSWAKALARPIRAFVLGPNHLTGMAYVGGVPRSISDAGRYRS